jgi:murein DD-endopeptidase MepM/ murein hydrolase activator NlpD
MSRRVYSFMRISGQIKIVAVIIALFIPLSGPGVYALSDSDLDSIYKDTVWYKRDGDTTGGGGAIPCSPDLVGSNGAEQTWNYFKDRGLNEVAIAAIMGNFSQEDSFNPKALQGGGESETVPLDGVTGYGIAQWTYITRQQNLDKFARDQNRRVYDMDLQLDFAFHEMTDNSPNDVWDNLSRFTSANQIPEATRYFHASFEGSADNESGIQERIDDAIRYFGLYGSGSGPGGGPGAGCAPGGGIGTSPDGFVFPLSTTKALVREGINGQRWCLESQSSCHHDYNAADVMVDTGTQVLAVRNGTITNIRSGPARLVLLADNGRSYFYTHMRAGSITVRDGQTVQAGDVIGAVGTDADGEGIRHLHIDELPRPPYDYRPGCSNAECQAYPFINIQPEMIAAFNQLP